jgi:hypothetical protein
MSVITNDYEAYLFIKNHLLNQGEKAMNPGEDCQYRGYKEETMEMLRENSGFYDYDSDYDDKAYDLFYDLLAEIKPDASCAVGCLILDQFYDQNLEGTVIELENGIMDAVRKSNPVWKITEKSYRMLKVLQSIHDAKQVENWKTHLNNLDGSFDAYKDFLPEIEEERQNGY